jgi:hypothetical protein
MRAILILLALLLCACANPRRDAAVGAPPVSVEAAASALTEELSHHGLQVRGVSADANELFWESDYSGDAAPSPRSEQIWVGYTLTYREILDISDVQNHSLGWMLEIAARGGKVRLWLDDRDSALRVKAALARLMQP